MVARYFLRVGFNLLLGEPERTAAFQIVSYRCLAFVVDQKRGTAGATGFEREIELTQS